MGFRLIPTSMSLNDLERRNRLIALIVRFFHRIALLCWPITSQWLKTNVRKILSPMYSLPILAITNPPCSVVSLL